MTWSHYREFKADVVYSHWCSVVDKQQDIVDKETMQSAFYSDHNMCCNYQPNGGNCNMYSHIDCRGMQVTPDSRVTTPFLALAHIKARSQMLCPFSSCSFIRCIWYCSIFLRHKMTCTWINTVLRTHSTLFWLQLCWYLADVGRTDWQCLLESWQFVVKCASSPINEQQ